MVAWDAQDTGVIFLIELLKGFLQFCIQFRSCLFFLRCFH